MKTDITWTCLHYIYYEIFSDYSDDNCLFQKTLKHTRYGRISVKCYYDAPEQRLTVEILHAADIIALDANGKTVTVWIK